MRKTISATQALSGQRARYLLRLLYQDRPQSWKIEQTLKEMEDLLDVIAGTDYSNNVQAAVVLHDFLDGLSPEDFCNLHPASLVRLLDEKNLDLSVNLFTSAQQQDLCLIIKHKIEVYGMECGKMGKADAWQFACSLALSAVAGGCLSRTAATGYQICFEQLAQIDGYWLGVGRDLIAPVRRFIEPQKKRPKSWSAEQTRVVYEARAIAFHRHATNLTKEGRPLDAIIRATQIIGGERYSGIATNPYYPSEPGQPLITAAREVVRDNANAAAKQNPFLMLHYVDQGLQSRNYPKNSLGEIGVQIVIDHAHMAAEQNPKQTETIIYRTLNYIHPNAAANPRLALMAPVIESFLFRFWAMEQVDRAFRRLEQSLIRRIERTNGLSTKPIRIQSQFSEEPERKISWRSRFLSRPKQNP